MRRYMQCIILCCIVCSGLISCRELGGSSDLVPADKKSRDIAKLYKVGQYNTVLVSVEAYYAGGGTDVLPLYYKGKTLIEKQEELNKRYNELSPGEKETYCKQKCVKWQPYNITFQNGRFVYDGADFMRIVNEQSESPIVDEALYAYYLLTGDPARDTTLEALRERAADNVKQWAAFLQQYPKSSEAPSAAFALAQAHQYLAGDYRVFLPGSIPVDTFNNHHLKEAIKNYKKVIAADSNQKLTLSALYFMSILLYLDHGSYEDARTGFETIIKQDSTSSAAGMAHYYLAEMAFHNDELERSKLEYQHALSILEKLRGTLTMEQLRHIGLPSENYYISLISEINIKINFINTQLDWQNELVKNKSAVCIAHDVTLRSTAYADPANANKIGQCDSGEQVIVLERSEYPVALAGGYNYWYKIKRKNNQTGWLYGKFLSFFRR